MNTVGATVAVAIRTRCIFGPWLVDRKETPSVASRDTLRAITLGLSTRLHDSPECDSSVRAWQVMLDLAKDAARLLEVRRTKRVQLLVFVVRVLTHKQYWLQC
jgi:hypothetical protein